MSSNPQWNTACSITDTVWGLIGKFNQEAFDQIYQIKERSYDKPLIVFAKNLEAAKNISKWNNQAEKLAQQHWPGALTIIVEKNDSCPNWLNPQIDSIAMRIPKSQSINSLHQDSELLLSTSANISSEEPVKNFKEAQNVFGSQVDLIVEPYGGETTSDIASTIIKVNGDELEIIRQGAIRLA